MHKDELDAIIRWRRRLAENEVAHDLLIAQAGCRSVIAGRKRSQLICGGAGMPALEPVFWGGGTTRLLVVFDLASHHEFSSVYNSLSLLYISHTLASQPDLCGVAQFNHNERYMVSGRFYDTRWSVYALTVAIAQPPS